MTSAFDESSPEIGRHGRMSADYLGAVNDLERNAPRPPDYTARLSVGYQQAVTDFVNDPSRFFRVVMDERFGRDGAGWPHDPMGRARQTEGGYRLTVHHDDHFVAVGAPVGSALRDVLVGATFRTLGAGPGGGYGLLLRDRGPGPRDARNQLGRYYVGQVNDRGEVGIWRREQDRWAELVPWTACPMLVDRANNDLSFECVGARLTLIVNGLPAATAIDATLDHGGVGLFVNGQGNDVLVERFVVHALS